MALVQRYKTACVEMCESMIRQSPRDPPPESDPAPDDPEAIVEWCELIKESYEAVGKSHHAHAAIRLLKPHLRNAAFREHLEAIVDEDVWAPPDDHLALIDLLLDGYALQTAAEREKDPSHGLEEGDAPLGSHRRRDAHPPVVEGERVDYGFKLQAYREVANHLVPEWTDRAEAELRRALVELALCAVQHLVPGE